jgi:hypothetical protein
MDRQKLRQSTTCFQIKFDLYILVYRHQAKLRIYMYFSLKFIYYVNFHISGQRILEF